MDISVFSFVDAARRAAQLMPNGGSIITLTYLGAERAIPNYNTMGVAKAALEAGDALRRPATWARRGSASTPSPPAPCAPCRWPASRAAAACCAQGPRA